MGHSERPILLVEDDPNDVLLMGRAFSQAGLENAFMVVRDGEEAVRFLRERIDRDLSGANLPSLILLDLKLPRKSGFEVLEWIRGERAVRRIPVVVLTSSKEQPDIDRAYECGASSYLVKPVTFEDLAQVVRTLKLFWLDLAKGPYPRGG